MVVSKASVSVAKTGDEKIGESAITGVVRSGEAMTMGDICAGEVAIGDAVAVPLGGQQVLVDWEALNSKKGELPNVGTGEDIGE